MTAFLDDVADELVVRNRDDWRHDAACRDEDPELFWPVGHSESALAQTARAKAVCVQCPVVSECRAWAFASSQYEGVWGGLSEDERRIMRRSSAPPPTPVPERHRRTNLHYPARRDA